VIFSEKDRKKMGEPSRKSPAGIWDDARGRETYDVMFFWHNQFFGEEPLLKKTKTEGKAAGGNLETDQKKKPKKPGVRHQKENLDREKRKKEHYKSFGGGINWRKKKKCPPLSVQSKKKEAKKKCKSQTRA